MRHVKTKSRNNILFQHPAEQLHSIYDERSVYLRSLRCYKLYDMYIHCTCFIFSAKKSACYTLHYAIENYCSCQFKYRNLIYLDKIGIWHDRRSLYWNQLFTGSAFYRRLLEKSSMFLWIRPNRLCLESDMSTGGEKSLGACELLLVLSTKTE